MRAVRSLFLLALVSAFLAIVAGDTPAVTAAPGGGSHGPAQVVQPNGTWPDRLIVRFVEDANPGELQRLQARLGVRGQVQRARSHLTRLEFAPGTDLAAMVAALETSGLVDLVSYDYVVRALETPNDAAFPDQWHLQAGVGGINAPAAWDLATAKGQGVVVAVIDTGVAYETTTGAISIFVQNFAAAPELAGVPIVAPYDFANDDSHANDDHGHGTHVAMTVLQATGNGASGAGMARNASLMPIKVLNYAGSGSTADLVEAIYYAAENGADVINMSLGFADSGAPDAEGRYCTQFPGLAQALDYAAGQGVTIVAAAGNEGASAVSCPAAHPAVIAVGATRVDGQVAWYSNTGANLDVTAPGGDPDVDQDHNGVPDGVLQQTFCLDWLTMLFGGDYTQFCDIQMSGTSMASPHVAGLAALLLGEYPTLNPNQVRYYLETTARDYGEAGWDSQYGWGLVDAAAAIASLKAGDPPPIAPPPPVTSGRPATPVNVTATATGTSSVVVSWTDVSNDEAGFRIERSADGVSFTQVGTISANATSYTNVGLSADTTYWYRVRSYNTAGLASNASNVATATTWPPPAAPTDLTAAASGASSVRLTWVDNATNEAGFKIERSTDAGATWTQVLVLGADTTSWNVTSLNASTAYAFRVRAYNGSVHSGYSNVGSATTWPPPTAPANLAALATGSTTIKLTWSDLSTTEQGFKVERSMDGVTWTQTAQLLANTTSWTATSLTPSTVYQFRVRAYDGTVTSAYSNVAGATTWAPPAAPSNLTATATATTIKLAWTDNATTEQGFKIERSADGGASWLQIATVGANVTTWTNQFLNPSTTFSYRLRAYEGTTNSPYSSTVTIATLPPPAAPAPFSAVALTSTSVQLSWTDNATGEQGFHVERSADGVSWVRVATLAPNATTWTNTGLSTKKTYYYRIRAYEGSVNGPYSAVVSVTTP